MSSSRKALSRAALLFGGAAVVSGAAALNGCVVAMYGPAAVEDAGVSSDANGDAASDAANDAQIVAMYGPAIIDGGDG